MLTKKNDAGNPANDGRDPPRVNDELRNRRFTQIHTDKQRVEKIKGTLLSLIRWVRGAKPQFPL